MTTERKYRVLIVDDEVSVLMTYRMILERHGYEVVACPTSADALRVLAGSTFDGLLCDYSLEDNHTGFEVIRAARELNSSVSAALLTGYATPETTQAAADLNIAIMFKPIDIPEFLETTARMVRGEL